MARVRNWMFTINNPTEDDVPTLEWKDSVYIVYQKEKGENGTEHYQGYVQFEKAHRLSALKKINARAHWEPRRGTHEQAVTYCTKEDTRMSEPVELGQSKEQGKRSDLIGVYEAAKDLSIPMKEVIEINPKVYFQYPKAVERVRALYVPERDWKTEVHWYYGPTGTGKSRKAFEEATNPYVHNMSNGKWFDGYEGQEDVIFDDMRKDTFKFHELLRLFDRYEMKVEFKGGMVNWCPKRIFVTTCLKPDEMYDTREDLQQLLRRIEIVEQFPKNKLIELKAPTDDQRPKKRKRSTLEENKERFPKAYEDWKKQFETKLANEGITAAEYYEKQKKLHGR